jgi:putative methyltransferase (TIGR04325 family)
MLAVAPGDLRWSTNKDKYAFENDPTICSTNVRRRNWMMSLRSSLRNIKELIRPKTPAPPMDLTGDFAHWHDAVSASTGYDSEIILEKTRLALMHVKNGEVVYERDAVLFDTIQYNWPTLAALMLAATKLNGELNVLDFGGSLGSSYFQNRRFLSELRSVRWNVVEQARHVEVGKEWFEDEQLRFYLSVDECLVDTEPTVALVSSVLQYVEQPYSILSSLFDSSITTVVVDRTPFWSGAQDRLCVQTVPPSIYEASYPSWILSRSSFVSRIPRDWEILTRFDSPDTLSGPVELAYEGVILVRKADSLKPGLRDAISSRLDQP